MATDRAFTQGRIRVNQEGAQEVLIALQKHEDDLLEGRDTVRGTEATSLFNRRVSAVRRVIEETERLHEERGWPHGELELSDT